MVYRGVVGAADKGQPQRAQRGTEKAAEDDYDFRHLPELLPRRGLMKSANPYAAPEFETPRPRFSRQRLVKWLLAAWPAVFALHGNARHA